MKLSDIFPDDELNEGVIRQYKKINGKVEKRFRCSGGQKKGKLVSKPSLCFKKKDRDKVRRGKKLMRTKKKLISRKTKVAKRKSISKLIKRMNKRLSGK